MSRSGTAAVDLPLLTALGGDFSEARIEDWSLLGQQAFVLLDPAREVALDASCNAFSVDEINDLETAAPNLFVLDSSENEFIIDLSDDGARAFNYLYDESYNPILDDQGVEVIAA